MSDPRDEPEQDPLTITADNAGPPTPNRGKLAIDMDDVLCETNQTIVDMHAEHFQQHADCPITIEEFEHYLYWHNRGWGTQSETVEMVVELYRNGLMDRPRPIAGAREGLQRLKDLGYSLIIITARSETQREGTEKWLEEHLPDIFDEIHFTGAFNHLIPVTRAEHEGHAAKRAVVSHKKRSKHEVIHQTGALLLVDDSAENALACAAATPPVRTLLFGSYPWNAEIVPPEGEGCAHPHDKLIYVDCAKEGLLHERRERRLQRIQRGWLPEYVNRVKDWDAVVEYVKGMDN